MHSTLYRDPLDEFLEKDLIFLVLMPKMIWQLQLLSLFQGLQPILLHIEVKHLTLMDDG